MNIDRFEEADSLNEADEKEKNVPLDEVFGEAGRYESRQIHEPGIYGYTLSGTINYFDVATVPIDATCFADLKDKKMQLPNSTMKDGWEVMGVTENIQDIFFPKKNTSLKNSGLLEKNTS